VELRIKELKTARDTEVGQLTAKLQQAENEVKQVKGQLQRSEENSYLDSLVDTKKLSYLPEHLRTAPVRDLLRQHLDRSGAVLVQDASGQYQLRDKAAPDVPWLDKTTMTQMDARAFAQKVLSETKTYRDVDNGPNIPAAIPAYPGAFPGAMPPGYPPQFQNPQVAQAQELYKQTQQQLQTMAQEAAKQQ